MKTPQLISSTRDFQATTFENKKDGHWYPCRPIILFNPIKNVKLAFFVLIGKHDALKWEGERQ